jgi:hypothetical protein
VAERGGDAALARPARVTFGTRVGRSKAPSSPRPGGAVHKPGRPGPPNPFGMHRASRPLEIFVFNEALRLLITRPRSSRCFLKAECVCLLASRPSR